MIGGTKCVFCAADFIFIYLQLLNFEIMIDLLTVNWSVDPEIIAIGPLSLRWYSILFISGFILVWFIFRGFFRREGVP
mgnify:FL=1